MALIILAALVGSIAVARATRLVTSDHYPPALAFRRWWFNHTATRDDWRAGWALLVSGDDPDTGGCPFCFAPYAAAVDLVWCLWSGAYHPGPATWSWAWWWWAVNGWAAVSYLAAMIVVRDEPPAE